MCLFLKYFLINHDKPLQLKKKHNLLKIVVAEGIAKKIMINSLTRQLGFQVVIFKR